MKPEAYVPGDKYPAISITGTSCSLNCAYCRSRFLRGMITAPTPVAMKSLLETLKRRNVEGALISGGFDGRGKLPLDRFIEVLAYASQDLKLRLSLHVGLLDRPEEARVIREVGVEVVDLDFTLDPLMLRMKNLQGKRSPRDYVETLKHLLEEGPPRTVPHLILGYPGRTVDTLEREVKTLNDAGVEAVVILVFTPARGTVFEGYKLDLGRVIEQTETVRSRFRGDVYLGCMRPPKIKEELDRELIERGLVDRIANPSPRTVREYKLNVVEACCSLPGF